MIRDEIKDALLDCIILKGENETDNVYGISAVPLIKGILDDAHVANSVYVYPIPGEDHDKPNMWCAATWSEAGQLQTVGFNYMTEERERKLAVFNKVMNNPYNGYYDRR